MTKHKKVFISILVAFVMISMCAISAFAANGVETFSDGGFPDYDNYWYSGSNSSEGDLYVLGDPNKSWTGITVKVNSFDENTAIYYEVYNADTGEKYNPGNISGAYRSDYLWNKSGKNQDVFKATSCRMFRIHFSVIGFPDASAGRVMVWSYKA